MFRPRTLKFLAAFLAVFLLLSLPAFVGPGSFDSLLGRVLVIPYLSLYLFHKMGIPGLLQNNGLCGWGWCAPTLSGWLPGLLPVGPAPLCNKAWRHTPTPGTFHCTDTFVYGYSKGGQ